MKLHYTYDSKGKFISSKPSRLSPLEEGVWLLPKNATFKEPPKASDDKEPYWDFEKKEWYLGIDKAYETHLDNIKKTQEQKELEERAIKLSERDDLGIKINILVNDIVTRKPEEKIREERVYIVKLHSKPKYNALKNIFFELCCTAFITNNLYAKDKLKEFKDKIEEVWNSIDGTKKPDEIIWPEPPEL